MNTSTKEQVFYSADYYDGYGYGSLLDDDGLAELERYATEHDVQVFVERVSRNGEGCTVMIEDGLVTEMSAAAACVDDGTMSVYQFDGQDGEANI